MSAFRLLSSMRICSPSWGDICPIWRSGWRKRRQAPRSAFIRAAAVSCRSTPHVAFRYAPRFPDQRPVRLAASTARAASKQPDIITLDMGGTSADVALIRGYEASVSFDRAVAGFPIRLPMLDIHTVGAGGGSIAWFDRDGLLKVGPLSAGADPGPACYGKGGKNATVTDANLLLGRLSAKGLIGGRMPLDLDAARAAIAPIAKRLDFSIEHTALGIIEIVVANMVRAIRTVSVERGHDRPELLPLALRRSGTASRQRSRTRTRHLPLPRSRGTGNPVRTGPDCFGFEGRHRPLCAHQT